MPNKLPYLAAGLVLAIIAIIYWPAIHGQFVWIDVLDFVQMGWLRHGDAWKHYIFRDFNNWPDYFRPLVVGLFTLQLRLFGVAPGPMHVVSIAMHLIDTLLVGLLAWQCSLKTNLDTRQRTAWLVVSMLLYGLHPVLAESVSWVGCQFDLAVTLFMLLGLLVNACIQHTIWRAITVAACFFLAACAKESAAAFPFALAVFDWARRPSSLDESFPFQVRSFIARHWQTYVALFVAGIVYLVFRHWGLGQVVRAGSDGVSSTFTRLQEVSFTYLQYWRMLFWPMHGMAPNHEFKPEQFATITPASLLIDIAAIGLALSSLYLAIRRASPIACIVTAMTVTLLPVLHLLPTAFAPSLYHEHYVMTSLALVCAMLPLVRLPTVFRRMDLKLLRPLIGALACFWLILSVVDIRMTIPLWSNNISLWRWALAMDPHSTVAKDALLNSYMQNRDYKHAQELADKIMAEHLQCPTCMLNAAILALDAHDLTRGQQALDDVKNTKEIAFDRQLFGTYLLATGQMLAMQGKLDDSEAVLRYAMTVTPLDSKVPMLLAITLALKGKESDARSYAATSITLLPPEQQEPMRKSLDNIIATDLKQASQPHGDKSKL